MTFLRIVLIPFFPILYLWGRALSIPDIVIPFILIFLLLVCQISDVLDGIFARKRNEVTDLGKVLDPMADSMLSLTILFSFTMPPLSLPILLVFVFLYREFVVSTLRTLCALKGFALAARKSGKIKTILQAVVFFFILILMVFYNFRMISLQALQKTSLFVVCIAAVYTVVSAIDYMIANKGYIKRSLNFKR